MRPTVPGRIILSFHKGIRIVGRGTILGILDSLSGGIAILHDMQSVGSILDILAVHTVAAAGGQDQTGRVRRADGAAVDIALIGTH